MQDLVLGASSAIRGRVDNLIIDVLTWNQQARRIIHFFEPYVVARPYRPALELKLSNVKAKYWDLSEAVPPLTLVYEGQEYKVEAYAFIVEDGVAHVHSELSGELQKLYLEALKQQLGIA